MKSSWGENITYSLFGESHGVGIGMTLHGIPAGIALNLEEIKKDMARRRPGQSDMTTPRDEADAFEILSGFFNGYTTGAPLTMFIHNTNQRSRDYSKVKTMMRPSHADYAAYVKYSGYNDYRGGGHFSGRLTAPVVFAGSVAKQLLLQKGISIGAHILSIGEIEDDKFGDVNVELLNALRTEHIPLINKNLHDQMTEAVLNAKADHDSVGGVVEACAINLPVGVGEPVFRSLESVISSLMFSIPGVKGVEFGLGFEASKLKGSFTNDPIYYEGDRVKTKTNNNGGITGGISNGMPIVVRTAFKPTATIGKKQSMIDVCQKEDIKESIEGRHDPCIVPRAVPVVEAMLAMGILELYMDYEKHKGWCKDE